MILGCLFLVVVHEQQTPDDAKRMVPQFPSLIPPWLSHSPWVRQTPSSPELVEHLVPDTGKSDVKEGSEPNDGIEPMPNRDVVVGVVGVCGTRASVIVQKKKRVTNCSISPNKMEMNFTDLSFGQLIGMIRREHGWIIIRIRFLLVWISKNVIGRLGNPCFQWMFSVAFLGSWIGYYY